MTVWAYLFQIGYGVLVNFQGNGGWGAKLTNWLIQISVNSQGAYL